MIDAKSIWFLSTQRLAAAAVLACGGWVQAHAMEQYVLPEVSADLAALVDHNFSLCSACDSCGDGCCDGCCDGVDCGGIGCDGVGCGEGCCDKKLLGQFKPSDHCFDDFISPMTNPVFFEDPRNLTEARAIFLQHHLPRDAAGGDVQLYALQLRAALTDRLSLVASKDGFAVSNNPLLDDGWGDLGVGLKYVLMADPQAQRLLSVGGGYELPVGSTRTLQGRGDGEFYFYLTGGAEFLDYGHWLSSMGFRIPVDGDEGSDSWWWSNHWDYQIFDKWYVLTEVNWFTWIGAGTQTALPGVEGGDLFNFGSVGVAGNDIVTQAIGIKYKRNRHRELGIAFEVPLTQRRDILENRLTVDWILRY
ncbi:MAG: hypothetical protein AAGA92_02975 [Planctomycetota bacterium]